MGKSGKKKFHLFLGFSLGEGEGRDDVIWYSGDRYHLQKIGRNIGSIFRG